MPRIHAGRSGEKGAVAIMVALSLVALVAVVGAVIDVARAVYARDLLQQAADAGSLAAGRETLSSTATQQAKETQLAAAAQKLIDANLKSAKNLVTVEPVKATYYPVVGTEADSVKISITGTTSTVFLKFTGMPAFTFKIESTTQFPQPGPIDLAMVLDTTSSMGATPTGGSESKLATLKSAATDLVNSVMASGSDNIRVGVVPYTSYVNVGLRSPAPSWVLPIVRNEPIVCLERSTTDCTPRVYYDCLIDGVMRTNGCVSGGFCTCLRSEARVFPWNGCIGARSVLAPNNPDRRDLNKFTDAYLNTIKDLPATPNSSIPSFSGQNDVSAGPGICPTTQIRALTPTKQNVLDTIAALKAGGDTHIPTGLIWGWNLLDPAEPYTARTKAELDGIGGRKVLLLMTDGINANSPRLWDGAYLPNGSTGLTLNPNWRDDGTKSNNLTTQICENIKGDGIQIYTVMFDVPPGSQIEAILTNCASKIDGKKTSFIATNRKELLDAFRDITDQLRMLKLKS